MHLCTHITHIKGIELTKPQFNTPANARVSLGIFCSLCERESNKKMII